jgi:hypothetical protein
MFRKSGFLAIALSVATIAFASVPAAAGFVKQPQVSKAYNPHLRTTVGPARYPMDRLGGTITGPRVAGGPAPRTTVGRAEMPTRFPTKSKK